MEKKYSNALVIGKFQPLHKGHMALIEFASTQAEHTAVCILAHEGELIPLEQRKTWIDATYGCRNDITIYALSYNPEELNESSESDVKASHEWANYLRKCFGESFNNFDVFIGSERHVQYMADYVGISHVIYDESRTNLEISATAIQNDIIRYWDYLSPAAKQTYARHICICGSESTGKSTVCKRLEEEYGFVTMIPEIGRCLVWKSEICSAATLEKIYELHRPLLEAVKADPPTPIILWDTDNITTLSYYRYLFPDAHPEFKDIPMADDYLFFMSNTPIPASVLSNIPFLKKLYIPFQDDGTRLTQEKAWELEKCHIGSYKDFGVSLNLVFENNRYDIVRDFILDKIDVLKYKFKKDDDRYTWLKDSNNITHNITHRPFVDSPLEENEIYVFVCERDGKKPESFDLVATRAYEEYGAQYGVCEGRQGQTYALPMHNMNRNRAVKRFIQYAKDHPELNFYVQDMHRDYDVYFYEARILPNVWLPSEFWEKWYPEKYIDFRSLPNFCK